MDSTVDKCTKTLADRREVELKVSLMLFFLHFVQIKAPILLVFDALARYVVGLSVVVYHRYIVAKW